jgi:hypothetical protein
MTFKSLEASYPEAVRFPAANFTNLITPPKEPLPQQFHAATPPPQLTMSFASPFRHSFPRTFESWTCSSCARSLARPARLRTPRFAAPRRCLNTTRENRQATAPNMEQMRAQFKQKNRTTMCESHLEGCCGGTDYGKELCLQHNSRYRRALVRISAYVQDGKPAKWQNVRPTRRK